MKSSNTISFVILLLFISGMVKAQTIVIDSIKKRSVVVADGAKLQLISDQFSFTEGPAADKKGNVFFTDQPNNKIWKYSISGKLSIFMDSAGRSNGMYFDQKGNLLTCADEHNQLWSISPKKEVTVLLKGLDELHFNGPNDLWVDGKNDIYFTDPYYQRDYWTRKAPELAAQNVYYLQRGKAPVIVADSMIRPNGIIGTADGKYLYVADIGAGKTYRFNIGADGKLTNKILFTNKGSDGMTIDEKGNIYLTGKGVSVFDPQGKQIEQIDVPASWTANATFGGKKKNVLFITASKAVYRIKMKVKGG